MIRFGPKGIKVMQNFTGKFNLNFQDCNPKNVSKRKAFRVYLKTILHCRHFTDGKLLTFAKDDIFLILQNHINKMSQY